MANTKAIAGGRWSVMDSTRQAHLNRSRKCSALTLPSLLPPEDSDENTQLETPWQTMGARCVNNLASKIVLTLMPPNTPCMRFSMEQKLIDELKAQMGNEKFESDVESTLSKREWEIQKWMEKSRIRVPSFRIMRLLIVTGNALMYRHPSNTLKVYKLDQYVVRRNGQGEPVEIITKEQISPENAPEVCKQGKEGEDTGKSSMLTMFTYCKLSRQEWKIHQEIGGVVVPKSEGKFKPEDFPFRVLVWSMADGRNYGSGHVEEHLGDFLALEELTRAVVETTAAAAKLLFLVNPNGVTRKKDLIDTDNGGFATGAEGDVTVLRVEKMQDLSIAAQEIETIKAGLAAAFLMHASIQRKGERVTAEEIRFMAQDIEDGLGGIYSILAQEYQLPLVEWALKAMEKAGKIDKLPPEISVSITTGLEALGRGHDLQKINTFMQQIGIIPPEKLEKYLDISEYLKRVATALSFDSTGLIRTAQEVQQIEVNASKQAQEQRTIETMSNSGVAKEMAKGVMAKGTQQPQQPQQPQQGTE